MNPLCGVINGCPNANVGASGQLFLKLINTLMASQCALDPRPTYQDSVTLENGSSYDFIVIGAGSAGSIVANRLSENPDWNVLLIEAGGYPSITTEIPLLFFDIIRTQEDWNYTAISDRGCQGYRDGICWMPQGKVLGGTGSMNGMIYHRGNTRDYDQWEALGNRNWGSSSVLKYFLRSEKTANPGYFNSPNHGHSGNIITSDVPHRGIIKNFILDSAKELGQPIHEDAAPLGYYETLLTIENGTRSSSAKGFIARINGRPNFYLATESEVTRLIIDPTTRTATAVEVNVNGNLVTINANKEIILSAGSISSPKILMSSKIGLREDVESPIAELAVGRNLQDHLMFAGMFVTLNDTVADPTTPTSGINDIYDYYVTNTGPLSGIGISNILGTLNTRNDSQFQNIQVNHVFYPKNDTFLLPTVLGKYRYNEVTAASIIEANKRYNILEIGPTLQTPKSVGSITFRNGELNINLNYLSDANGEDEKALLDAADYVKRFVETPKMRSADAKILRYETLNCNDKSDVAYWKCLINNFATTEFHLAGTCKMGPASDPGAVVDDRLRVHGIANLRVIDASIMPNVVSGNTYAPTMMIGEYGSDFIKIDHGYNV